MDVIALGETMMQFTPESEGLMRHAATYIAKIAGAETNTLIGLARLGHNTGWISKVGNDEFGHKILMAVRGEGVDTSQTRMDPSFPTGTFFKEIVREGEVRIQYYRENSAASKLSTDDLDESYFAGVKYLFITGITPALSKSAKEAIFNSIELAKKNDLKVVFDPNIRKKLWSESEAKKALIEIAKHADIVLPGKSEGDFLFGTDDPKQIADSFLRLGASLVVVKLGDKGAYYSQRQTTGFVPGFKVPKIVDPVGAGDSFAAGLLSGLIDNESIPDAVKRGCAMGAMAVMVKGDYEGLPDKKRLKQFMSQDPQEDILR
ncbi:2-dehydro-3-deoxygluconokinase [Terribacillus saccharophilus]|uniref:2-dehydro-3-deoxygluconokinase n=1 Tax=Terribacillus saccharophilus TaxID=361277 RepID=A0A268HH24_9BACI|nr:sugar kinase [Terribacillus saccharophilus]PAE09176.1 2-dehydro-3-deoxygluconokinase [Terribacillus saccharophilus]